MVLAGRLATGREVERFRTEAQTAAQLRHPHIVAIHEVGEHEGRPYFTMDCVPGRTLAQIVQELCNVAPQQFLTITNRTDTVEWKDLDTVNPSTRFYRAVMKSC